ncbi:MAG TPA: YbjQ family protein [Candidatus Paceibacterota bacterium]|nr:YbjQ family protein [Candidatus Paceibacterota bacterium]
MATIDTSMVTTAFVLDGYKISRDLGITRGIIVRSRSLVGNIGAGIQTLFGGNITLYTALCEQARTHAYDLMVEHAEQMGANAIVGFRYDATEIAGGVTEVLAYGTAVIAERA